ncbi:MAG TPA: citrate transporter [Gammaproteobacteria bacterium]|nr:citrate transporter [Gammaproteobacteria bacterium]
MNMRWMFGAMCLLAPVMALAVSESPMVFGIPFDFILFALTLLGVALFHHYTLQVALTGLLIISLYKIGFTGFHEGAGFSGWLAHLQHEWVVLTNLLGLLLGFALLARHFEDSGVPHALPRFLPDDWKGAFVLLVMVFVMSAFLDNIAAALIGGTVAAGVFRRRVHIGYLAAIVAASNAGGSGSVVGDTTTTMMWIDGVAPADVLHAYAAAIPALLIFGFVAARQQQAYQPIQKDASAGAGVDWARLGIVAWILLAAVGTNIIVNTQFPEVSDAFPFLGAAVWVAILLAVPLRKPEWSLLPDATKGSIFLLSLVVIASMMPVEKLPLASWQTAFGLGFISSVFDNIPLTALALAQGGYDWGVLAYAVGFGGSMIWFGSSAGVALSNLFPEARSVGSWLKHGWHVAVAYVIGFFIMLAIVGWHPHDPHKDMPVAPTHVEAVQSH